MGSNEETNAAGNQRLRPPMLGESDYDLGKIPYTTQYIRGKQNGKLIWKSIQNGPTPHPRMITMADTQAEIILSQGLPRHIFSNLNQTSTAKEIWDNVELLMQGSVLSTRLVNDMKITQLNKSKLDSDEPQFVNNLSAYWGKYVTNVKQNMDYLNTTYCSDLYSSQSHEPHAKKTSQETGAVYNIFREAPVNVGNTCAREQEGDMLPTAEEKDMLLEMHRTQTWKKPPMPAVRFHGQKTVLSTSATNNPVNEKDLSGDQVYWLSANEIASQASKPATPATPFVHKSRPPSQLSSLLVEGLQHNLFSVGTSFLMELSISLNDMMSASPVCLLTKASSTKSWLWHRRLNHLNFGTLNELARKNLVRGLPMLKYDKDHLCPSCQLGKSKKASHPLKTANTNTEVLHTLHMDLCGPMRTDSINRKKYALVIVDDYTRFGWVRFLRSKDETPHAIEKFIVKTQRALNATVRFVRTDNGTETALSKDGTELLWKLLVLWAEAVATACYTLNRSLVHTLHGKTYYELLKGKKPNLQYFRVFGSLCYPTNDYDDVGKLKAKADIGIFVGYAPPNKAYRLTTKERQIQETVIMLLSNELTEGLTSLFKPVQASHLIQMTLCQTCTELELTLLYSQDGQPFLH
ncbi:retrovirus-related pol polyprotein from transposon TNT 1-94 [Tanacetum coccineum]